MAALGANQVHAARLLRQASPAPPNPINFVLMTGVMLRRCGWLSGALSHGATHRICLLVSMHAAQVSACLTSMA